MATDYYIDADLAAGNRSSAGNGAGGRILVIIGTYEKLAADTDNSTLRIGKVPANAVPLPKLSSIENDAIAGFTAVDLGLYKPGVGGAVVDANILLAAADLHSANTGTDPFAAVTLDKRGQNLLTLLGLAVGAHEEFDIVLGGATLGANIGTISWQLAFLVPQQ